MVVDQNFSRSFDEPSNEFYQLGNKFQPEPSARTVSIKMNTIKIIKDEYVSRPLLN